MKKFISCADFNEKGGWLLDSQFIETMGMPYLLAHGIGTPVSDAKATVQIDSDGKYQYGDRQDHYYNSNDCQY